MARSDPFTIFGTTEEVRDNTIPKYFESRWQGDEFTPDRSLSGNAGLSVPLNRFRWVGVIVAAVFAIVGFRIFGLQIVNGAEYRNRAEYNRLKKVVDKAPRGILFDRNGVALVENTPEFSLMLDTSELSGSAADRRAALATISVVTGISLEEIDMKIDQAETTDVELRTGIAYDNARALRVSLKDEPALSLTVKPVRHYLATEAYAHVIGYLGKISPKELEKDDSYLVTDSVGKDGLERQYESYLRGVDGGTQIEHDSRNNEQRVIASVDAVPGDSLILTIDDHVQQALYQGLEDMVKKTHQATGGAAVALDPRTGAVLAMVSYPSFDSNAMTAGKPAEYVQSLFNDNRTPLFNRAVSGEYAPGSTFKPVVASAALQNGVITDQTTVLSTGGIRINSWFFPDWKSGGHGVTDVRKAIADSVNTFFYTIGGGYEKINGLGVSAMTQFAERFGMGEKLGIDLPHEATGFLPSADWKERVKKEQWYIGDTYHYAIGQGDVLATPLQIASATATVANGGTVWRPHLLKELRSSTNTVVKAEPIEAINEHIISPFVAQVVREGMRQAVTSGSSTALSNFPVPVAGKTGTAQTPSGTTHGWFSSFAPFDSPEIVITVVIENGGEGHAVALPVARQGLAAYFNR